MAPDGLSFANTSTDVPAGLFGGNLGAEDCIPDYFSDHPNTPTSTGSTSIEAEDVGKTIYIEKSPSGATPMVTINIANLPGLTYNVRNSTNTTVYVDGNVTLQSNVKYSNVYMSVADIPSFRIIARGNIYVDPNVTELDGVYVAEPDVSPITDAASNGVIYTCTTVPFMPTPPGPYLQENLASYYSTCDKHLDVYGSVMARQVWLLRTYGTLYHTSEQPAETFHYTPELGLSPSKSNLDTYDAITSLPPVL